MKKTTIILIISIFFLNNLFCQKIIEMKEVNGIFQIPCKVNGIPMNFIFDTGASDVSISITEAKFLLKQGLLKKEDFLENVNYQIANGEIIEGLKINLNTIEIDGYILKNITATVIYNQHAPLLLGQSAISKIGQYSINQNKLILDDLNNSSFENIKKQKSDLTVGLNCIPMKGFKLEANSNNIELKLSPNINSETIVSPRKDNFWLTCVEDGLNNDYIKVEIYLNYEAFEEYGIDENIFFLYYSKIDNSKITLKEFLKIITKEDELRKIYYELKKSKTLDSWSDDADFKEAMKTFEGFRKYWIKFDDKKLNLDYVINNQDRIVYVHKSDVVNNSRTYFIKGESINYYEDEINKLISYKEINSYAFVEDLFFGNFSEFINIQIENDPFVAIQKINSYSSFFEIRENLIKVEYLKMIASYEDKNYSGTITTGKKIINDYKEKKEFIILDEKVEMYDYINLDAVYGYLISSLIKLNEFD